MAIKKNWGKMTAEELEAAVRRHNRLYFAEHAPEIPDAEFDRLVEALRKKHPASPALVEIVSDAAAAAPKVRHAIPMLSLGKCYDEKALREWAAKFSGDVVASPKIDGCAIAIRYGAKGRLAQAATRGDGAWGEEITANARHIRSIPQTIRLAGAEVRGEVYMPLSVFARYRDAFSNPRNLAAGAIKQKDPRKTGEYSLAFFAYDLLLPSESRGQRPEARKDQRPPVDTEEGKYKLLAKEGFMVVEWKKISRDGMQQAFEHFLARRETFDFETDGVVFKADDVAEQGRLGSTAHHPRYAIAYKFQGDSGETTLLDVEWSVARTGVITPVAVVEPVELSGALVKRASLHNVGIMRQLGITKEARVLMMRRGGVIPNVEAVVAAGKGAIEIPKRCPSCGSPTRLQDDFLFCAEPAACAQSRVGWLSHFVKTVGIDGFGEKLLAQLSESGVVTDPAELYELTRDELLRMERMGETLAAKLLANVESRRRIPLGLFLQSLGIRELGRHAAKILARCGSLEKIMALTEEELSAIHTIGPVIAREVVEGLEGKRPLIEKLLRHVRVEEAQAEAAAGPIEGKSFLFTGALLAMERKAAEELVEEKGGSAAQSVTKGLDYLVVGDGGGAGSKLEKAKRLQQQGGKVKIITEKEFLRMVK